MAVYAGPEVVTDGLVLSLDAGNSRSYGNDTTWRDVSGKGNNGTIYNGPTYSSANGGSLLFDGSNDTVEVLHNAASMDFSAAQTLCIWLKPTHTGSNTARRNPYSQAYGGPGTLTYEAVSCCGPVHTFNYFFGISGIDGGTYVNRNSVFTVVASELAFICVTRNQAANTCNWYKNGILQSAQDAGGYASTANGTNKIVVGSGYAGVWLGNIYSTVVYNRALSAAEVAQNYAATRGRFGL